MRRADRSRRRDGFTLVELMVALVISAMVLIGARLMIETLSGATHRTIAAARSADHVANGDQFLRTLFGRLEIGTADDQPFGGSPRSVHFTTWCDSPGGWLERCQAVISLEVYGDTNCLVAHLVPRDPHGDIGPRTIRVATGFGTGALRYLNDPRAGGQWFTQWGDGIVAPLAIGVVLDGDTSIVRIGERG
jgi:prepilin-type N-terminal cleavage/methylation domain-containing protein